MTQLSQPIKLQCTNCGAKLEITSDLDVFACGYCGIQQVVHRQGEVIALKKLTETIERVQGEVERTAAEVTMMRLQQENAEYQRRCGDLEMRMRAPSKLKKAALVYLGAGMGLVVVGGSSQAGGLAAMGALLFVLGLILGFLYLNRRAKRDYRSFVRQNGRQFADNEREIKRSLKLIKKGR